MFLPAGTAPEGSSRRPAPDTRKMGLNPFSPACFGTILTPPTGCGRGNLLTLLFQGETMPTIYDLVKDHPTTVAQVGQTVYEVARTMVEQNIGAVPVLQDGQLAGIFSERDLMRRVVVEGRDPRATRVEEVMTTDPLVVSPTASMEECMVIMRNHGFRHLPICDGKKLRGLVSLRDLLLRDLSEKDDEVRMMRAYIHAVPGM